MGLPFTTALGLGTLGYTLLTGRWRKARLAVEEAVCNLADGSILRLWMTRLMKGLRQEGSAYLDQGQPDVTQDISPGHAVKR